MSETEIPSPATTAGADRELARLDATVETLTARATLALSERDAALRAPFVLAGGDETDLGERKLEEMRLNRAARVTGTARNICAEAKTRFRVVLDELKALGEQHSRTRYLREASTRPENLAAQLALRDVLGTELLEHVRDGMERGDVPVVVSAAAELARRPKVPGGVRREADALLAALEFPQRQRLLERAEAIRRKAAAGLVAVADIVDGRDAAASKAAVARAHLPPVRGENGQLDRPMPPAIWSE